VFGCNRTPNKAHSRLIPLGPGSRAAPSQPTSLRTSKGEGGEASLASMRSPATALGGFHGSLRINLPCSSAVLSRRSIQPPYSTSSEGKSGPGGDRTHDQGIMSYRPLSAVLPADSPGHLRASRRHYFGQASSAVEQDVVVRNTKVLRRLRPILDSDRPTRCRSRLRPRAWFRRSCVSRS